MGRTRTIIDAHGVTVDRVGGWFRATRLSGGGPGLHLVSRLSDTLDETLTTAAGWVYEAEGVEGVGRWLAKVVDLPGCGDWWDYVWDGSEFPSFYEVEDWCEGE